MRAVANLRQQIQRVHSSAGQIVRVLDFNQPRRRPVRTQRPNLAFESTPSDRMPVRRCNRPSHTPRKPRHHRQFVVQDVAPRLADHLLPMLGVKLDRDGVSHRARRHEREPLPCLGFPPRVLPAGSPSDLRHTRRPRPRASAIACRISGVGFVTVSLRKSIMRPRTPGTLR